MGGPGVLSIQGRCTVLFMQTYTSLSPHCHAPFCHRRQRGNCLFLVLPYFFFCRRCCCCCLTKRINSLATVSSGLSGWQVGAKWVVGG